MSWIQREADTPLDPEGDTPLWTDTCENITFPQLLLRTVKRAKTKSFRWNDDAVRVSNRVLRKRDQTFWILLVVNVLFTP